VRESPRLIGSNFFAKEMHGGNFDRKSADSKRSAQYSDSGEGDHILLNKSRDNKLSPNFEPLPYKVVEKKGNAVLIQDQEGNNKLRNASHMKKLIQPDPPTGATEVHGGDQTEHLPTGKQLETTVLTPTTNVDKQSTLYLLNPVQVLFLQGPLVLGALQHG